MSNLWVWDVVPIVCVNSATPKNKISTSQQDVIEWMIVFVSIQYISFLAIHQIWFYVNSSWYPKVIMSLKPAILSRDSWAGIGSTTPPVTAATPCYRQIQDHLYLLSKVDVEYLKIGMMVTTTYWLFTYHISPTCGEMVMVKMVRLNRY